MKKAIVNKEVLLMFLQGIASGWEVPNIDLVNLSYNKYNYESNLER
jgi:hypothetical protein